MKVLLIVLILAGGLVWWLGGRRVAMLFGVPKNWTTRRGGMIFAAIIITAVLAVTSMPYLQ